MVGSQAESAGAASIVQCARVEAFSFDASLGVGAVIRSLALKLNAFNGRISSGLSWATAQRLVIGCRQALGSFSASKLRRVARTAARVVNASSSERAVGVCKALSWTFAASSGD
jgi:hypothetical protein